MLFWIADEYLAFNMIRGQENCGKPHEKSLFQYMNIYNS